MGRQAKSFEQHLLHGTVPQSRPEKPSVFVSGRPLFPKHLSPAARQEFKRCVKLLERRGTLTPGDQAALAVYSEVYARWVLAKQAIGDDLMQETVVTDNHGVARTVRRVHPLLKVVQNCEAQLLALAKSLGLTPVDREKAKPTKPNEDEEKIVPGSCADLMPELFGLPPKAGRRIVPIAPPIVEEIEEGGN